MSATGCYEFKRVLIRHLEWSGKILQWKNILTFLLSEMEKKKEIRRRSTYVYGNAVCLTRRIYVDILLLGNESEAFHQKLPDLINAAMENVFLMDTFNTCPAKFDVAKVYYDKNNFTNPHQALIQHFADFDESRWTLSDLPSMTVADLDIIQQYITEYLSFFAMLLQKVETLPRVQSSDCKKLFSIVQKRLESFCYYTL
jgi:hypothetical protein